ncbi:hypothetical protein GW916_10875 [bacterium]|nr:hypothetical protein [bacterium]
MINRILGWVHSTILQKKTWKKEWQDELAKALETAQAPLSLNFVVVIAAESDLYTEILYFVSFLGLLIGTALGFAVRSFGGAEWPDPLFFPLLGYTSGSLLHIFRKQFLRKTFSTLAEKKVHSKAQSYFVDYSNQIHGSVAMLYLSETERLAVFLASPGIDDKLPKKEILQALMRLESNYTKKAPLESLLPAIENITILLRSHIPELDPTVAKAATPPLFVGPSDQAKHFVPVLKGNKDIN